MKVGVFRGATKHFREFAASIEAAAANIHSSLFNSKLVRDLGSEESLSEPQTDNMKSHKKITRSVSDNPDNNDGDGDLEFVNKFFFHSR